MKLWEKKDEIENAHAQDIVMRRTRMKSDMDAQTSMGKKKQNVEKEEEKKKMLNLVQQIQIFYALIN